MLQDAMTVGGKLTDLDRRLLWAMIGLLACGLLMIYSADHAQGLMNHITKQAALAGAGMILLAIAIALPPRIFYAFAFILYGLAVVMLFVVLIAGIIGFGARRWISIAGINMQPAEFAKITFIFAAARALSYQPEMTSHWRNVGLIAALAFLPMALVLAQPDLGTATTFPVVGAAMLAWLGLPLKFFIFFLLPALALFMTVNPYLVGIPLLIGFVFLWRERVGRATLILVALGCLATTVAGPYGWHHLKPYQRKRLLTFIEPSADPLGAGYQIIQSKVAIGSGGFTGSGYLKGTQTQLRFLPQQHTDFIFALAGEEFGFVGSTLIVALLFAVVWRGYVIAGQSRNPYGSLIAAGMTTLIAYHILVNIGMAVGLLPVTGLPLPFLSYGGSFLITCITAVGVILGVGLHRRER